MTWTESVSASFRARHHIDHADDAHQVLLSLERGGILTPGQREIAIERLLALDTEELDLEQVKWVVLMVLSSQPGQEAACARMEDLVYELPETVPH